MALAVPLTMGGMIVSAAIIGRVFLAEPLTPRVLLALAILLAAIGVLIVGPVTPPGRCPRIRFSLAADRRRRRRLRSGRVLHDPQFDPAVLRHPRCAQPALLFIVSTVGLFSLGGLASFRIGPDGMLATRSADLAIMLAAGVCNTVAFLALTKSLQLNSVVYVNALNATQATLAALAGVVIFREKLSPYLVVGIGLTILGLTALAWAHRAMRARRKNRHQSAGRINVAEFARRSIEGQRHRPRRNDSYRRVDCGRT